MVLYLIQAIDLLLVAEEHVCVDLVDEDLVADVLIHSAARLDDIAQTDAVRLVILRLCIYDVDERAALLNSLNVLLVGLLKIVGPWVVLDGELDVRVVVDLYI